MSHNKIEIYGLPDSASEERKAAIAQFEVALNALSAAGLYLHAFEDKLAIHRDGRKSAAYYESIAEVSFDPYLAADSFYTYHLSDQQKALNEALADFKKLLGKDND